MKQVLFILLCSFTIVNPAPTQIVKSGYLQSGFIEYSIVDSTEQTIRQVAEFEK